MDTTVVCVYKTGGDFTKEYVYRLMKGAEENGADDFICLTDDKSVAEFCEIIPLTDDLPGWWSKLELFKLTEGKYVYFDLDTIIKDDITEFLKYPHQFTMLKDFNDKVDRPASGIMAWSGDYSELYYSFDKKEIDLYNPKKGGKLGDQAYIADKLPFKPDYVQYLFPEFTCSYKWSTIQIKQQTKTICYHGKPRPIDTNWSIY